MCFCVNFVFFWFFLICFFGWCCFFDFGAFFVVVVFILCGAICFSFGCGGLGFFLSLFVVQEAKFGFFFFFLLHSSWVFFIPLYNTLALRIGGKKNGR